MNDDNQGERKSSKVVGVLLAVGLLLALTYALINYNPSQYGQEDQFDRCVAAAKEAGVSAEVLEMLQPEAAASLTERERVLMRQAAELGKFAIRCRDYIDPPAEDTEPAG